MAYVAITDRLINDVERKINSMRSAETAGVPNVDNIRAEILKDPAVMALCIDKLWEREKDLRDRLSKYNKKGQLKLTVVHDYVTESGEKKRIKIFNARELPTTDAIPCLADTGDGYYKYAAVTLPETFDPRCTTIAEAEKQLEEIKGRWDAVETQVKNFLRSCKSLNEAVKLWPDVTRYIPKEDMERLEKNAPKQQKEASKALEALKAMDFDTINASTVLARMAGAKV